MMTHDEMKAALSARYPAALARLRGFEFREGWAPIIDSVLHVANRRWPQFKPSVIKEKFGSLRIQGVIVGPGVFELVRTAEAMSDRVCELTGRRGRLGKTGGVWQTLAPNVKPGFQFASLGGTPVPLDLTVADVERKHPAVLSGGVGGIPEGYADLLDAGLGQLSQSGWPPQPSGQQVGVRATFDGIALTLTDQNPEHEAVCEFLEHLSGAVDPVTGAMSWR